MASERNPSDAFRRHLAYTARPHKSGGGVFLDTFADPVRTFDSLEEAEAFLKGGRYFTEGLGGGLGSGVPDQSKR